MLKEIIEPLLDWYDANARVLPWREEPSPYRVWEIGRASCRERVCQYV